MEIRAVDGPIMGIKTEMTTGYRGFTLIELLIAMAVSAVVMTAVFAAYQSQQKSYVVQEEVATLQQKLRFAVFTLGKELRMAGYDPSQNRDAGAGISTAQPATVTFSFVADEDGDDNDNDGQTDERGELETIQYLLNDAYSDGTMDLCASFNSGSPQPVILNAEAINFLYFDEDGNITTNNPDIKSVEVTIVVRASREDPDYTDDRSYPNRQGDTILPAQNDHFRRRMESLRIDCRNLGLVGT